MRASSGCRAAGRAQAGLARERALCSLARRLAQHGLQSPRESHPHCMLRTLGDFLASSIGKKAVMALTGLLLVLFLIGHLVGNLTLFADASGATFDEYARKIRSFGALVYVAEVGLLALFAAHIYLAVRTLSENREARPVGYAARSSRGAKTVGSATMFLTGAIVLGFVVKHLIDFRFDGAFHDAPAGVVKAKLAQPWTAGMYVVGLLALGVHLSHALRSALQSLGLGRKAAYPALARAALVLALLIALGFLAFPLVGLLFY